MFKCFFKQSTFFQLRIKKEYVESVTCKYTKLETNVTVPIFYFIFTNLKSSISAPPPPIKVVVTPDYR